MGEKVLFIDDEPSVLEGFQRLLRQDFEVNTAQGGYLGLAAIQSCGPFAVIISDMRMPEMNGVEFLSQVRHRAPDSVRMLLTGHADLDAAIDAVNKGNIFRFLTKPCKKQVLVDAIQCGLDQFRIAKSQRELARKAQALENIKSDWETTDDSPLDDLEALAGLPGPARALACLQTRFGTDRQCYVLMIKLTMLHTVEERYGEKAAADYLMGAVQFIAQGLHPGDQFFQWSRDVLMAVLKRQISPAAVRMEVTRLLMDNPQHLVEQAGKKTMIALSTTFDLLPVAQFSTLDEMMTAFKAKPIRAV
jgi:FixJ family two-component response regulator